MFQVISPEQFYVACCTADRFYEAIDLTIAAFPVEGMPHEEQRGEIIRQMLIYWPPTGSC
jgi:hypothetical protein